MTEVRRRSVLGLGASAAGVALGGVVLGAPMTGSRWTDRAQVPLFSGGVGVTAGGERVLLAPEETFPRAGSRVLDDPTGSSEISRVEVELLEAVRARIDPRWDALVTSSVLDLNALSHGLPAPVAAWTPNWRYVWPRDAAHVCRAWAQLGRVDEVLTWLAFLAGVQRDDGHFEARSTLLGEVPDERPKQADGVGWFLWSLGECWTALPDHRPQLVKVAGGAAAAALRAIYADLDSSAGLPGPSPDYWEVHERRTTLGVAAVTLAGLQSAARVGEELCQEAGRAQVAADGLASAIRKRFGRTGYQRYERGGGVDAALTFLLPPYVQGMEREVGPMLDQAWQEMARPAGGVAPGAAWRQDGISWTPETALFAQAYAALQREARAREILGWLERHRTPAGSLPEKVLRDGSPAAVAPLAWTGAVVASTALGLLR